MREWLSRVLSSSQGVPSTKRHVVAAAAGVLCVACLWVAAACSWWIYRNGDLGSGAMGALTLLSGVLAGLAGSAYRKPEVGAAAPPAGGGTPSPTQEDGGVGNSDCVGTARAADPGAPSGGTR